MVWGIAIAHLFSSSPAPMAKDTDSLRKEGKTMNLVCGEAVAVLYSGCSKHDSFGRSEEELKGQRVHIS